MVKILDWVTGAQSTPGGKPQHAGHFAALDALRGVAALCVVWYHFAGRLNLPFLFPHGYLAVDFFFVLSGFVIAKAYTERLSSGSLPVLKFCLLRLIRLAPLAIIGTLIAAGIEWRRPTVIDQTTHIHDTLLALLMGFALIPTLWSTTLEQTVFPLNGAIWSLFFEILANFVFAPLAKLRARYLIVPILAVSAAGLIYASLKAGSVNVGVYVDSFWFGSFRVAWSFTAGIVLFHWKDHAPRCGVWFPLLTLVAILLCPLAGHWNACFDDICVLAIFPALVMAGSSISVSPAGAKWCSAVGDLSYPVYAIHYPVVRAIGHVGLGLNLSLAGRMAIVMGGSVLIAIVAMSVYRLVDIPVRRALVGRLSQRRAPGASISQRLLADRTPAP